MNLKVFVASTTSDLSAQRAYVLSRLEKMDVKVLSMNNMNAGAEPPHVTSERLVSECDILIAIVAYRRGQLIRDDPKGRSITQHEVDVAERLGKDILPFVLDDRPQNREAWNPEYNELDSDQHLVAWRHHLTHDMTATPFHYGENPDVLPGVHKLIRRRFEERQLRLKRGLRIAAVLAVASVLTLAFVSPARAAFISFCHSWDDPVVFNGSRQGPYKIARLFDSRADIQDNASFAKDIAAANDSFWMFANTFGSFREYEKEFDAAARKGVKLRFVVSDFHQPAAESPNWFKFQQVVEEGKFNAEETVIKGMNTISGIKELQSRFPPGQIEYRLNRDPILHTMWVRDPDDEKGMAHLGVHFYGRISQSKWPAIRVSKVSGGNQLTAIAEQFEYLWSRAVPDEN